MANIFIFFKSLLYIAFIKVSLIIYVDLKLFLCVCIELEYALNNTINRIFMKICATDIVKIVTILVYLFTTFIACSLLPKQYTV